MYNNKTMTIAPGKRMSPFMLGFVYGFEGLDYNNPFDRLTEKIYHTEYSLGYTRGENYEALCNGLQNFRQVLDRH